MKYSACVFLIFCSIYPIPIAQAQKKDPAKEDVDIVQGTWGGVSSITEGKETAKAELDVMRLIVKGDQWNYAIGDGPPIFDPAPKFVLDPKAKPKTIDVKVN